MNVIAKLCDEMGVSVIITTNSPSVIRRIPSENVILLVRDRGPSEVVRPPTTAQLATILGGGAAFRGAVLVEDQAAKDFVSAIFEEIMAEVLSRFEFTATGSREQISNVLAGMPRTGSWLTLVGAYDGDQRGQIVTTSLHWPIIFLPGAEDPDKLLKGVLDSTERICELLSEELRKPAADVMIALNRIAGTDYHDCVSELANSLNLSCGMVRRGLVRIWLQRAENRRAAQDFKDEFRAAVDRVHS